MLFAFIFGRILLAMFFFMNGINHFKHHKGLVAYAKSKKAPFPELTVPLSGLLLFFSGVSFLTGLYPVFGVVCAVLFFVPVTFVMHGFWNEQDDQVKSTQRIQFWKNMAIMAACLMFLAIPQPWEMSLMF